MSLDCKKPKPCVPNEPEKVIYPPPTAPFDLCVGDYVFHWDGTRATITRTRTTPDGTYSTVTTVDGCVTEYGYADEASYTPPYCNPNPTSCQETGTGSGGVVTISPSSGNTLVQTSNGLFAKTYIQGGTGVEVTGGGTQTNPYIVKLATTASGSGTATVVGRNGLVSETSALGVTYIGMEETGVKTGVYDINDVFTIDKYGRIVSAEARQDPLITAGAGLEATNHGDSVQIAHPTHNIENAIAAGAYVLAVNNSGHIIETQRAIHLDAGVYNLGAYHVGINEYGSINSIQQSDDVMPSAGSFTSLDGKTIMYDVTGRLTGIAGQGGQGSTTSSVPMAIRDMFKIFPSGSSSPPTKEVYGKDTPITNTGMGVQIALPAYVASTAQIEVNGATSWTADFAARTMVVSPHFTTPFTLVFRG